MSGVDAAAPTLADEAAATGNVVPHAAPSAGVRVVRSVATVGSGAVAAITGIAPHVLHHVGPLAGAAFLAGAGGTLLFGAAGFALSIPMLLRLRRRFGSWAAPALASAVFTAVYLTSALVIGPALTAEPAAADQPAPRASPAEHAEHH